MYTISTDQNTLIDTELGIQYKAVDSYPLMFSEQGSCNGCKFLEDGCPNVEGSEDDPESFCTTGRHDGRQIIWVLDSKTNP